MSSSSESGVPCTHCRLPVPAGLIQPDREEQFCCHGCESAYNLIHGCGLEAYYAIAQRSSDGVLSPVSNEDDRKYLEFDSQKFQEAFAKQEGDRSSITLVIEGIHCAACVWLLEKLPQVIPGVAEAQVNWGRRTIHISWVRQQVQLSQIALTLAHLGYPPHPLRKGGAEQLQTQENRTQLIRLGIAGAAAGNNMLIATALYLGDYSHMTSDVTYFLRWASCVVGVVSLLGPGQVFLRGAWFALKTRTPHMDLPIALGLMVGGINGIWNTLTGSGEIYFDSLSVLVFVLLLGRYIQYRQQQAAADSIEMLYRLTPKTARRLTEGDWVTVPTDLLEPGDTVEVRAGEAFPADGVIRLGQTEVDQAILTGESVPVTCREGDEVAAGTLNAQARVEMEIRRIGMETRIGKVLELVEASSRSKPAIVQTADRIGAYFVVTVIVLASLTLVGWLAYQPAVAVDRAVALLIVACPCALALATPLAISVGLGRAATHHLLIKSGDVFQRLSRPGMIWLDKTGTLTLGQMQMKHWHGPDWLRTAVGSIQSHSDHPIAKAMVKGLGHQATDVSDGPSAIDVQQSPLGGIRGTFEGQTLGIGNRKFAAGFVADGNLESSATDPQLVVVTAELLKQGLSPIYVVADGRWSGVAGVGDPLRPGIAQAVQRLQADGWQVGILSGDHQQVVSHVAEQIGIPQSMALGAMLPEDKVHQLQKWTTDAPVVMVGDGVNDSAALAAASVGIAAHHSAETSLQAAPVYLGQPGLQGILTLLQLSRGTIRNIRQNFLVSLAYNFLAVILASIGWINPLLAALLMPISSISVVGLSFLPTMVDPAEPR